MLPEEERRRSALQRRRSLLSRTFLKESVAASTYFGPQVSRYQDHFSLQAPTTTVKFANSKSAARVIYNEGSQLVLQESYDEVARKRHVSIKQVQEEDNGTLSILRATYTVVGFFFAGFLFIFSIQLILFVILDLAINAGTTDLSDPHYGLAVGVLFAFPLLIHGLSLMNMLAGLFVIDLWRGHRLFKKFIFPSVRDEVVEWIFLLGFLLLPLTLMGCCLMAKTEKWWEYTELFWFSSVFFFYIMFGVSLVFAEAKLFYSVCVAFATQESLLDRLLHSAMLRKRHSLSGYARTTYSSFGSPEDAVFGQGEAGRSHIVQGTLYENQRSLYARFTEWSSLGGRFYEKLEEFPKRMYSVDDLIGRRPYITTYSWDLERYFCKPRKTRYIGILRGPGAITSTQFKSTIVCAVMGVTLIYFLIAAFLIYIELPWSVFAVCLVLVIALTLPFCLSPCKLNTELGKIRLIKDEWKRKSVLFPPLHLPAMLQNPSEVPQSLLPKEATESLTRKGALSADIQLEESQSNNPVLPDTKVDGSNELKSESVNYNHNSVEMENGRGLQLKIDTIPTAISESNNDNIAVVEHTVASNDLPSMHEHSHGKESQIEWKGFSKENENLSMGIYATSEKYRITQPTKPLILFWFFMELLFLVFWPTLALYSIESWQLATIFFFLALFSMFRHISNSEILLQETGITSFQGMDERTRWEHENRISTLAGMISRGKSYQAWRFIFSLITIMLLAVGLQALSTSVESKWEGNFDTVPDFYYKPLHSLHYTTCEVTSNLQTNLSVSLADYAFFSLEAYRLPEVSQQEIPNWFGPDKVEERADIVEAFRSDEEPRIPVYYRLFTMVVNESQYAVVSIRGTHNAWDFLADGQLWSAALFLQVLRSFLPWGYTIWTPILDEIIVFLGAIQSGTLEKLSFYTATTAFVEYLQESGNYTSVLITGHSLGGGLGIISGAKTGALAVSISGPNAILSHKRFDIDVGDIERYTFNVIPDRDITAKIDDPSKNVQRIECRAPANRFFKCHDVLRSICELQYSCGSGARPVPCQCATEMNYLEPIPYANTTRTFAQACGEIQS